MLYQPNKNSTVLKTPRIRLRPMVREDLDFVHEVLSDPEAMKHYPKCYSRDEANAWIDRTHDRYRNDGCGLWMAEIEPGILVGMIGMLIQEVDGIREPEVGYLVHRKFWRQGFAKEAATAVLDYAFDIRGHSHAISLIRPSNLASQAVAKSIGMTIWKSTRFRGLEHLVLRVRSVDRLLALPTQVNFR